MRSSFVALDCSSSERRRAATRDFSARDCLSRSRSRWRSPRSAARRVSALPAVAILSSIARRIESTSSLTSTSSAL